MDAELRKAAFDLYKSPFRFDAIGGFVWDGANRMVADQGAIGELTPLLVARVRGWGRIGYMPNAEALQDAVGELIAEALNDLWAKHAFGVREDGNG